MRKANSDPRATLAGITFAAVLILVLLAIWTTTPALIVAALIVALLLDALGRMAL